MSVHLSVCLSICLIVGVIFCLSVWFAIFCLVFAGNTDQDPAAFGPAVIASSRAALLVRYSLLPVYYSLFFRASMNGSTVVRPLFFEFPEDRTTYEVDWQFLVGEHLMVSPVLSPNTTEVLVYFPSGRW